MTAGLAHFIKSGDSKLREITWRPGLDYQGHCWGYLVAILSASQANRVSL